MLKIESESFKPTKDYVFIAADKDKASHYKSGALDIIIDTRFNPHARLNATQDGTLKYLPLKLTSKGKIEANIGDRVFAHHFLCNDENRVDVNGEILYHILYESVYFKITDGVITMLNDYNLVEAVVEKEKSSIIITPDMAKKKSNNTGVIKHVNKELSELGVKSGDTIIFTKNSDYDIDVDGTMFYCMKNRDIVAIVEGLNN